MTVHDPLGPQPEKEVPVPQEPGGPPEPVTPLLPDPTPGREPQPRPVPPEPRPAEPEPEPEPV